MKGKYSGSLLLAICCSLGFFGPYVSAQDDTAMPRMADGKPDLNGTWDNGGGIPAFVNPQQLDGESICVSGCTQEAPGSTAALPPDRPVYKPEYREKVSDLEARQVLEDPVLRCLPPGLPRIGPPDKIVQQEQFIVFLYEDVTGNYFRLVPMNTTEFRDDMDEMYFGASYGYWDGDTLVIETSKFTADTWLTDDGSFHSPNLKVTERITRTGDTIEWLATATDPDVLLEPWNLRPRTAHLTDLEIAEAPPCIDHDMANMEDLSNHDNPR